MFRFTKWLGSTASLGGWERWFTSRGIKTEILKEGQFFALFREGEETVGPEQEEKLPNDGGVSYLSKTYPPK